MQPSKHRELYSIIFGFHEKIALCSYVNKEKKAVILLSSMHLNTAVDENSQKRKPEIIIHYNKTKVGVDTMDQLAGRYSTQRRTNRWPLALFYYMLDVAAIAAYKVYYENNSMLKKKVKIK